MKYRGAPEYHTSMPHDWALRAKGNTTRGGGEATTSEVGVLREVHVSLRRQDFLDAIEINYYLAVGCNNTTGASELSGRGIVSNRDATK